MAQVWKYSIPLQDRFVVEMARSAQAVAVGVQADGPVLWAVVDPAEEKVPRTFRLVGTGHEFDYDNGMYVGTFQLRVPGGGEFVGHVFEVVTL